LAPAGGDVEHSGRNPVTRARRHRREPDECVPGLETDPTFGVGVFLGTIGFVALVFAFLAFVLAPALGDLSTATDDADRADPRGPRRALDRCAGDGMGGQDSPYM
jgi:hypothetical protein